MRKQIRLGAVLPLIGILLLLTISAGIVNAQNPPDNSNNSPFPETKENTLIFNHCKLEFQESTKVTDSFQGIPVLRVSHGEHFQVRFEETDPHKFNYSITAGTEEQVKTVSQAGKGKGIKSAAEGESRLVMRHDRHFQYYTVTIDLREELKGTTAEAPPTTESTPESAEPREIPRVGKECKLYSISFPVWVETIGWQLSFSGGVAFSNLTSDQFFIKTDNAGTPDNANDDIKTVELDPNDGDDFKPDVIAIANLRHPHKWKDFGMAFGFGIGDDSDPRYFLGGSYTLGDSFIFTGGWTGGQVNALPVGQEVGEPSIVGDNLTLRKRFRHGVYFGIAFTFVKRESEFIQKTSVTKKAEDTEKKPDQPEPNDEEGADNKDKNDKDDDKDD